MIPALVQPLRKRESILKGRLLANDKSGMWEMAGAASAPQKGWSDVGGFRMSPKWIGGKKKNAAEKEGGIAGNVGKDDTTGNERFLFIDSNLVVRENWDS